MWNYIWLQTTKRKTEHTGQVRICTPKLQISEKPETDY